MATGAYRPAHGITFHHFLGDGFPRIQGAISAHELARLIDHLGRDSVLPADQWIDRARDGALAPGQVCLTFDDALRCQYEIALPVLDALGLTAIWFVYTSPLEGVAERLELYRQFRNVAFDSVGAFYDAFYAQARETDGEEAGLALHDFRPEDYLAQYPFYSAADRSFRFVRDEVLGPARYNATMDALIAAKGWNAAPDTIWLNADHIRRLSRDGHVIGLHSHTHPTRIADLPRTAQYAEYAQNRDTLAALTGEAPRVVAHPCNSYDATTLSVLGDLGVDIGFRADLAAGQTTLELPRLDHAVLMDDMTAEAA